jgi:hypothetical protein
MQTSIAAGAAHKGAGQVDLTVPLCMVPSIKGKRLEIYLGSHTLEGGNSHPRSAAMPPHGAEVAPDENRMIVRHGAPYCSAILQPSEYRSE